MQVRVITSIAVNMLRESFRSKLFWSLSCFLVLFFAFSVYISALSLDTPGRFLFNAGMTGLTLVGLGVTILFGLYSLYEEKNRCELYVILNRIPRHTYLMGRFAGTVVIQVIFAVATSAGIFLLTGYFGKMIHWGIMTAAIWSILEFSLLIAVAVFFYAFNLGFTVNAALLLATFFIGHSMEDALISFKALGRTASELHLWVVKGLCVLMPNFDFLNYRLDLLHHDPIPIAKIMISTGYWVCYLTGVMIVASVVFRKRDI